MQTWKRLSTQPVGAGACGADLMGLPALAWVVAESCGIVCTSPCFGGLLNCEGSYLSSPSGVEMIPLAPVLGIVTQTPE